MSDQRERLMEQAELDEWRRTLVEREAALDRRESELGARESAKSDATSSHVRDVQDLRTRLQAKERGYTEACEANRTLAEEVNRLMSQVGAKDERIQKTEAALSKRDAWNKKIMDERESLIAKLRTRDGELSMARGELASIKSEIRRIETEYTRLSRAAQTKEAAMKQEIASLRISMQAGGIRR